MAVKSFAFGKVEEAMTIEEDSDIPIFKEYDLPALGRLVFFYRLKRLVFDLFTMDVALYRVHEGFRADVSRTLNRACIETVRLTRKISR